MDEEGCALIDKIYTRKDIGSVKAEEVVNAHKQLARPRNRENDMILA
jgi:hypothetical protein